MNSKTRVLVIQIARMGDTLQSLMALRAAKQLYPQLEITLLTRECFSDAAKRVPWLEKVITLPDQSLIGPILNGKREEKQVLGDLARWAAPLIDKPWDYVLNWSFSEASSYLAGLIPARVKLGYSRKRSDLSFACLDGWSHYMQAIIQSEVEQNIHLTDILTTQLLTALQIHVGDPENEEAQNNPVTSKAFFNLELGEESIGWDWRDATRKWIGIQIGSSPGKKSWHPAQYARLASILMKRHPECGVVLLGARKDEELAKSILADVAQPRTILSLVGKTDFDLWASVIGNCQWLFAEDTAAVHLASVLGTRVINILTQQQRFSETGPYGNGHYVISGKHVSPETAYATWSYASTEWTHRRQMTLTEHFEHLGYSNLLTESSIYRSKIRGTQDGGGVVYEAMRDGPIELNEWLSQVVGHIARAWYCGWTPPVAQEVSRTRISPELIRSLRSLEESTEVLAKICDEAQRSAATLQLKSSKLKSDRLMQVSERDELRKLGQKLLDLDVLIERLGKAQSPLIGFAHMSKVLMHNLGGTQLSDLGRETALSYSQLGQGVGIFREWIQHTLALAKPVALKAVSQEIST